MGVVLMVTTVFTPISSDTDVTIYFSCEPKHAWPQIEAVLGPNFERANRRLLDLLSARSETA
jgi:hypothetical protein